MPTVLLVGEDELLLQTRAAVLRTTGALTVCAKTDYALAVQKVQRCDLIILCHTVPQANCLALATALRNLWPGPPVLRITRTMTWEASDADVTHEICSAEPERLIQRAVHLLAHTPAPTINPLEMLYPVKVLTPAAI